MKVCLSTLLLAFTSLIQLRISEGLLLPRANIRFQLHHTSPPQQTGYSTARGLPLHMAATGLSTTTERKLVRPSDKVMDALGEGILKGTKFAKCFDDDSVFAAVESMNTVRRSSVLVYSRDGNLKGIFTERDFVTKNSWRLRRKTRSQKHDHFFRLHLNSFG